MGLFRSKEEKAQIESGKALLAQLGAGGASLDQSLETAVRLTNDPAVLAIPAKDRTRLMDEALERVAGHALEDDILTAAEEASVLQLAEALGLTDDDLAERHAALMVQLFVAMVNDGRLPVVSGSRLMQKRDEVVHLEVPAALMKEVAVREYRGGYSGVSFRVAKGVRFHTGGVRGKSVVVGTEMQVADTGMLAVTSHRAVFLGSRKTTEFPYGKLVDLEVFSDGIKLGVTTRQNASLFQVPSGEVVAATINAAVQAAS